MTTLCKGSETEPSKLFDEDSGYCPDCNRVCSLRQDGTVRKHVPCERSPLPACKDCRAEGLTKLRPAPHPGPRCATHWRVEKKRRGHASKERKVAAKFEMSPELYDALYAYQGGLCAICRMAKGNVRRLAVDHDHSCLEGHSLDRGCLKCIRGLLCKRCNYGGIPLTLSAITRALKYLTDPPFRRMMRERAALDASNTS